MHLERVNCSCWLKVITPFWHFWLQDSTENGQKVKWERERGTGSERTTNWDLNSGQKMALLRYCCLSLPIVKDELLQQNTFGSSQGHNHYRHWGGHVFPQYSDQIEAYTLNLALFKYLIFSYIIGSLCIITINGTYFINSQQNKWLMKNRNTAIDRQEDLKKNFDNKLICGMNLNMVKYVLYIQNYYLDTGILAFQFPCKT